MEHQLQLLRTNVAADSNDFELLGAISQRVFGALFHNDYFCVYAIAGTCMQAFTCTGDGHDL